MSSKKKKTRHCSKSCQKDLPGIFGKPENIFLTHVNVRVSVIIVCVIEEKVICMR